MMFGALFLNVQRLFGGGATDIFYRIGWAFALSSPIGFLVFITLDEFSPIVNINNVRYVIILGLIPLYIAVVMHEGSTLLVGLNSLRLLKR